MTPALQFMMFPVTAGQQSSRRGRKLTAAEVAAHTKANGGLKSGLEIASLPNDEFDNIAQFICFDAVDVVCPPRLCASSDRKSVG